MAATNGDRLDKAGETMDRVSVRLPVALLNQIEAAVDDGQYPNRSVAIRAALEGELGGGE